MSVIKQIIGFSAIYIAFIQVGYASFAAYHMTTESSLVALNKILPNPVGMDRFRANVIIGGTEPFAEVCC